MRFRDLINATFIAALALAAPLMSGCGEDVSVAPSPPASSPPRSGSGIAAVAALQAEPAPRTRIAFNSGWRFIKGDPADAGDELSYPHLREALLSNVEPSSFTVRPTAGTNPGNDVAYAQPDFDDSSWRPLDLPHDWGIEGPFDQSLSGETGKLPYFGTAWYRKAFEVPASDAGKRIFLNVDGAMSYASVWLNGQYIGGWPYGYSSWQAELTSFLNPGATNTLAVRLDNPNNSSRWYPGGGIYRNVWLEVVNPVHVQHWGVFVTTPEVSADAATVDVQVTLDNQTASTVNVLVTASIFAVDPDGRLAGNPVASSTSAPLTLATNGDTTTKLSMTVATPKLWGLKTPNLYAVVTRLRQDGQDLDAKRTNFGIRTLAFDPNAGFFLNGEHIQLQGVCMHSDLGALGTAINTRGLERQIETLQAMGSNAIRTSHNPPSPELLDLCDRMGMLVMDESFDTWTHTKTQNDYGLLFNDWSEHDLRAEVRRDRNHPSIIMYSAGNEVSNQGSEEGNQLLRELIGYIHDEDPTRPVTTANNGAGFTGQDPADYLYGFNYKPTQYASYHQAYPDLFLFSTESASTVSSRGVYLFPVSNNPLQGDDNSTFQVSSYDLYARIGANIPDTEFRGLDKNPFAGGEFVWTGFDYLGEPMRSGVFQPPDVPSRSSYFGIVDLAGFKKDRFYIYQAHWRPDFPMAHILPHWNWQGREGEVTPVHVYTSGDAAELFLNGQSLGRKQKGDLEYRIRWDDVTYAPGELRVIAYKNGQTWAEDTVKTTGNAAAIAVTPDRARIASDGQDLSYVTVAIKDGDGLTVPTAMHALHYEVSGPGEVIAVDNGDATSHDPMQGTADSKAFNGLALVIVRAHPGATGRITLTAVADGLASGTATIEATVDQAS